MSQVDLTSNVAQSALLTNEGIALMAAGNVNDALDHFNRAIVLNPKLAAAYYNRATLQIQLPHQNMDQMLADFQLAASLEPNNAKLLQHIGAKLLAYEFLIEGVQTLQRSVELDPNNADAWMLLVDGYHLLGDTDSTLKFYEYLIQRFPDNKTIQLRDALFIPNIAASNEAIEQSRARITQKLKSLLAKNFICDDPTRDIRNSLFYLYYQGQYHRPMAEMLAQFFLKTCPSLHFTAPHCSLPRKKPGEKLKIGFVSPSMHQVTLNQFFTEIMATLANSPDWEVHIFSNAPSNNATVSDLKKRFPHYHQLPNHHEAAYPIIAEQQMDVLLHLEIGCSHLMYLLGFARLAPLQCVWGGIAATTGIPTIDYYLSCRDAEPDNAQDHYSETLAMTDRTVCVLKKPQITLPFKSRAELGLPTGDYRLYACPVQIFKIHPDMDRAFGEILKRDPKAVLLFFSNKKSLMPEYLKRRFQRHIPSEYHDRIIFMPYFNRDDFMHLLRAVDCLLDSFHYSFGTTAFLAFAACAPFVTWQGPYLSGRVGWRMYNCVGNTELVAHTQEEYVALAIKLAQDKSFYARISQVMAERGDQFFDDYAVIDDLSALLKQLYFERPAQ
ncbi:MAG: hypothetical protein SFT92_06845 [Rickettsiales bacterium]|nr:hypothetical protein [Rickettsiales bacterium]